VGWKVPSIECSAKNGCEVLMSFWKKYSRVLRFLELKLYLKKMRWNSIEASDKEEDMFPLSWFQAGTWKIGNNSLQ